MLLPSGFVGATASSYQIARSLRFNSADTTKLTRTPAGAGNRRKMTISFWSKKCVIQAGASYDQILVQNSGVAGGGAAFSWNANDDFLCYMPSGMNLVTRGKNRDPAAWDHLVIGIDTDQTTATDRVKIYRNGSDDTLTSGTYPTLNVDLTINQAVAQYIGGNSADSFKANVYLAEMYFIDGQQLTASSFGETDSVTGAWVPKAYTGTYGTNGFYLDFSDNSNTTSSTLGKDRSGNNNDWTPSNFSVTAGVGNDSLTDTPTNYGTDTGAGGEVRGNYCTLNSINAKSTTLLTNGNLRLAGPGSGAQYAALGTFGMKGGKWYWEYLVTVGGNEVMPGFCDAAISRTQINDGVFTGSDYEAYGYQDTNGNKRSNAGGSVAYGNSFTTNAVIGCALDLDNGKAWWSKNGTWQASGDPAAGTSAAFTGLDTAKSWVVWGSVNGNATPNLEFNFGQRPFAATAPSGFKALCTQNLPTPAIAKPSDKFEAFTYTGNGSGSMAQRDLAASSFQPGWAWLKGRSGATDHAQYDSVRGVTKDFGNSGSPAQTTETTGLTAFNSNGIGIKELAKINTNAATYVAWLWKVDVASGVDVISFTGTGAQQNVAHGLGVTPRMYWFRKNASADSIWVYHADANASPQNGAMFMGGTQAFSSSSSYFGNTAPDATNISVGLSASNTTACTAWALAEVEGFSRIRKYTGNAAADGPFVWCGFRPKFVLIKSSTAVDAWLIYDSARDTYNVMPTTLVPNTTAAEAAISGLDFLSNGFKLRTITTTPNAAQTYVFAAFAEHPFKYARAR